MTKTPALFVGRFQPFHLGHLAAVKQIDSTADIDRILIGIGSCQESGTFQNPYSFHEREAMINASLKGKTTKPYKVFGIEDMYDDELWYQMLKLTSREKFEVVYTNNDWVSRILSVRGVEIRHPQVAKPICATQVRHLIASGQPYQSFLPVEVADYLKTINHQYINPCLTADTIINYQNQGIVLIQRRQESGDPNSLKWALPGGHLNYGLETLEQTAVRETKEETNLDVSISQTDQFRQYSDPHRDPRGHYATTVYSTTVNQGHPRAGDDAVDIKVFPLDKIPLNLAFDHGQILADYCQFINSKKEALCPVKL